MLCYNDSKTLKHSIESILPLSDFKNIEVIVVDNESNDGSRELLSEYQSRNQIKFVSRKCSRGLGRQIAFENSHGDYIMACMDCDDEFIAENVNHVIDAYHERYDGLVLMTKKEKDSAKEASNITIAPRNVVLEVGGWRDINWCEDWDFWARAAAAKKYVFVGYPYSNPPHKSITIRIKRETSLVARLKTRYNKYKDASRIGRPPYAEGEKVSLSQKTMYVLARVSVLLNRNRLAPVPNPHFSDTVSSD